MRAKPPFHPDLPANEPPDPRHAGIPLALEQLLVRACREVQPLAVLSPADADAERARAIDDLRAGRRAAPRWSYAPVGHDELRRALDAAERELARSADPLHGAYLDRVRELALEADLCAAAGRDELATLAQRRFAPPDAATERAASELGARWIAEPPPAAPVDEPLPADDPDPRSLLSRLRRAVGAGRLPFAVSACPGLAPLAATGERVIIVAAGRPVHEEDAVRTVLHEVEGHARPRARAVSAPLAIFRAGTARGTDDQEGYALVLEERAGLLTARRRRQLAARHRSVEAMLAGGTFGDVASMLAGVHGLDPPEAVRIAERVFRGSRGDRPGLGRERVYLESYVRVRAHLDAHPGDEHVLRAGQIAVHAAPLMRRWAADGVSA